MERNMKIDKKVLTAFSVFVLVVGLVAFSATAENESAKAKQTAKSIEKTAPTPKPVVEKPKKKKLQVYILSGQSNMVGMGLVNGLDRLGTMETVVKTDKKFQNMVNADGSWKVRDDVYFVDITNGRTAMWMTVGCMAKGNRIGPETGFGFIMGDHHDEMVLVIKAAQGNRSLAFDVMPPSSRVGLPQGPGQFYKGWQWNAFVKDIHKILDNLKDYFPAYDGKGYEVAGFCWWQGHKDKGMSQRYYERHLVNLIKDFRKEFDAPDAKFAVATVGFEGKNMSRAYKQILKAQMAVSDYKKYPKFKGNVASIDIREFWRGTSVSPKSSGSHYNLNAETYTLVGDALGKAMVEMVK